MTDSYTHRWVCACEGELDASCAACAIHSLIDQCRAAERERDAAVKRQAWLQGELTEAKGELAVLRVDRDEKGRDEVLAHAAPFLRDALISCQEHCYVQGPEEEARFQALIDIAEAAAAKLGVVPNTIGCGGGVIIWKEK